MYSDYLSVDEVLKMGKLHCEWNYRNCLVISINASISAERLVCIAKNASVGQNY